MQPALGTGRNQTRVIRQQMGHSSERMTTLYSGEIPLDQVRAAFSGKLLKKMENEANSFSEKEKVGMRTWR
jgi:hypothetical protein